jgi:hypothetical protein
MKDRWDPRLRLALVYRVGVGAASSDARPWPSGASLVLTGHRKYCILGSD